MTEWAIAEQWNPGPNDFECYYATDPNGIWMAKLDGKPAACVFIITYDSNFGFAGLLITRPGLRGSGVGFAVWQKAVEACKATTIGAYGLVDLEEYYKKPGYDLVMVDRNVRYVGVPSLDTGLQSVIQDGIVRINSANLDAVYSYDHEIFPVKRTSFLSAWLSAPQHIGHVAVKNGQVTGYGVIRPCHGEVNRIGPLFADDAKTAGNLFRALIADSGVRWPVIVDVPEPNQNAVNLCRQYGLKPGIVTGRMYRGPPISLPLNRIFGIELG